MLAEVLALRERAEVRAIAAQSCRSDRISVGRATAARNQALDVEIALFLATVTLTGAHGLLCRCVATVMLRWSLLCNR